MLAHKIWIILEGQKTNLILMRNLMLFILAVLNLPVKAGIIPLFEPENQSLSTTIPAERLDESNIVTQNLYELWF